MKSILSVFRTIIYCLSLSWKSSKIYTLIRLSGSIAVSFIGILLSFLLKQIIDLLSESNFTNNNWNNFISNKEIALTCFLIAITCISVFKAVTDKIMEYSTRMHMDIIDNYITRQMIENTLNANLELFDNPEYRNKLTSIRQDLSSIAGSVFSVLNLITSIITFLSVFIILSASNLWYGIIVMLASVPSAFVDQKYTKELYHLSLENISGERQKEYVYHISSSKNFAVDIRIFQIGSMLKNKYNRLCDKILIQRREKLKSKTVFACIFELLPEIMIFFITLKIGFGVLNGLNSVGDYSFYTGLLSQMWVSILLLINSIVLIYDNKLKLDNIKSFEKISFMEIKDGNMDIEDIKTIEFKEVCFSYPNTSKMILKNISFFIGEKEKVVLVGINGSGKTTIIKLLMRFYDVDEGMILINSINIKEYKIDSLRKCFSVYFQESSNFAFSIRENIIFSDVDKENDSKIYDIFSRLNGSNIVDKAEEGLETQITRFFSENGLELSGGENQKVALVRTLYKNCSAVILDEPSSSLDPEAEYMLFEVLREYCMDKTTLFTSHRLSNVALADRIVVIENGEIIENGTEKELLENPKRYAVLYKYQAQKYNERSLSV